MQIWSSVAAWAWTFKKITIALGDRACYLCLCGSPQRWHCPQASVWHQAVAWATDISTDLAAIRPWTPGHGPQWLQGLGHHHGLRWQHGFRQQHRRGTSTWPSLVTQATDINSDSYCSRTWVPDMALDASPDLGTTMVSGGIAGHSHQYGPLRSMTYGHKHEFRPRHRP